MNKEKKVFSCGFIGTDAEHNNNQDLCFLGNSTFSRYPKVENCIYLKEAL